MYVYNYGSIGKAIRTKIEGFKQQVRGGESNSVSFSEVLKSQLNRESSGTKVVSATGNSTLSSDAVPTVSGSTLLYAIQNNEDETTAGAVLSALGFTTVSSDNGLKDAADDLSVATEQLIKANNVGTDKTAALIEFVADFNKLSTMLGATGSSSSYLYKTALSAMLNSNADELKAAGLTAENGLLTYTGGEGQLPDLFLSNVSSTAATISAYAGAVESENENGVAEYYSALINM